MKKILYLALLVFTTPSLLSIPQKMVVTVPFADLRSKPEFMPQGLQGPAFSKDVVAQNSQVLFGEKLLLNEVANTPAGWLNCSAVEQEVIDLKNVIGENLIEKLLENYDVFVSDLHNWIANEGEVYSFYVYGEYLDLISFYSELYGVKANITEKLLEDFKKLHKDMKKNSQFQNYLKSRKKPQKWNKKGW